MVLTWVASLVIETVVKRVEQLVEEMAAMMVEIWVSEMDLLTDCRWADNLVVKKVIETEFSQETMLAEQWDDARGKQLAAEMDTEMDSTQVVEKDLKLACLMDTMLDMQLESNEAGLKVSLKDNKQVGQLALTVEYCWAALKDNLTVGKWDDNLGILKVYQSVVRMALSVVNELANKQVSQLDLKMALNSAVQKEKPLVAFVDASWVDYMVQMLDVPMAVMTEIEEVEKTVHKLV